MNIPLFRLGLIVTYRCNVECRHCFFRSGPGRDEVMSLDLGMRAIDGAVELGAEWVSLTGGESFLERELLERLVEYASGKGLMTEVVSNGYWAETPEVAETILKPLRELGLDVLNLSIDDFHQEYIPMLSVRNAYQAALGLGLKVVIMTTTAKNSKITAETIPGLLKDDKIQILGAPRIRDPNALLIETPITPVGRAENIAEHEYTLITSVKCGEVLRDIGIGPEGDVYPCCGPLASKIVLGNIKESALRSILEKAWKDPVFTSIREGASISGIYTSKCHACLSLAD
jgi:radical SAM protein with 4Fe4S-binding SPASM domain